MYQRDLLLSEIQKNNGFITTKEALKKGINKETLKVLTSKEIIVKVAYGLYSLPNEDIDEYTYFSHRIPKGIFSNDTAAYIHGLTSRMPLVYVMTVNSGDNVSRITNDRDDIIFKYIKKEFYDIGREKCLNPFGRYIWVYDRERTILDVIRDRNNMDLSVFSEVLKNYFSSNEKNLFKLSQYAQIMKLEDSLRLYTEVLLWSLQNN